MTGIFRDLAAALGKLAGAFGFDEQDREWAEKIDREGR